MPTETENPPTKPNFRAEFGAAVKESLAQARAEAAGQAPAAPTPPPAAPAPTTPPSTPPPAPAATPDPDDDILSGKRSPKADDFRRIKKSRDDVAKERDDHKAKLGEFEKELGELRKAPKHNAELIQTLEKERDEYKTKYDAFIVQFTPEFHQKFDSQISSVVAGLKSTIGEAEANKLSDLLQLPNTEAKRKAIAEITEGMDQFQVADVVAANREIQRISNEKREAISKAQQTLSNITTERQKQAEERKGALSKIFDAEMERASKGEKAIPVYQPREKDEAWNQSVSERSNIARKIFNGEFENDSERAQAALWAASAPGILNEYKTVVAAKDAEITTLKETLAKLQAASPGMEGGAGGGKGGEVTTRGLEGFKQGFKKAMQG